MRKLNKEYMMWSLLFCIVIPIFIPSNFSNEGMGNYSFGFPLKYITIYQREPNSMWFLENFFNGNAGLAINIVPFALNVFIVYLVVKSVADKIYKKKDLDSNVK
ncbi:hypothetical protein GCM10011351_00170 [Paraliobacillus quinghaiensis]|uniref:Uncharacterized protein n=1 Tax=Paraliobacillus quinghaiensis TaxID=470815 RepID=A0A917TD65_9BACI|nr:hypothetical protein [Paraliobacillus quinghaiensis]GGM18356.1 hypothetical protein GCM10011351_00170 [Paraliobacillus quinghaiensis]